MRNLFPVLLLTILPSAVPAAGLSEREVYQPIIDARPFGDMAANAAADGRSAAEEQKQKEAIAQKFRMCGITDTPEGIRKIAFVDETSGVPVSYLIGVGETQNGFTLLGADYDAATATLRKDGLTFTLGLGRGLLDTAEVGGDPVAAPAVPLAPAVPQTRPMRRPNAGGARTAGSGEPSERGSFKARLMRRRAAEKAEANEERLALQRRVAEAEADSIQANRRIQIERIKQGLAPTVPITLTPEEDAELEAAGVFGGLRQPESQPAEAVPPEETDAP